MADQDDSWDLPKPPGLRGSDERPRMPEPPLDDGERTVIGMGLPSSAFWSRATAGAGPAAPAGAAAPVIPEGTWSGLGGQGAWPGSQGGWPAPQGGRSGAAPEQWSPNVGSGRPAADWSAQPGGGLFPAGAPPEPSSVAPAPVPRVALTDALKSTGLSQAGLRNPLMAAGADLLMLLGRLRSGVVEINGRALLGNVAQMIDRFEREALSAGAPREDVELGKYALCATADDIVQNLPGTDREAWIHQGMSARFFQDRTAGVGFFERLDAAMRAPRQRLDAIELMLVCLCMGFEGRYRTSRQGAAELVRLRRILHETLRQERPQADGDLSVHWTAMPHQQRRIAAAIPSWVIGGTAIAVVATLFATFATLLTAQGSRVTQEISALHQPEIVPLRERSVPDVAEPQVSEATFVPEDSQFDRIRAFLAPEIGEGSIEVEPMTDFIALRLGQSLRFRPGSDQLDTDLGPLATRIVEVLEAEPGPVLVVGHTDADPPSGRGSFHSNEELSLARATTVSGILAQGLGDPSRLTAEGRGASEPIADNDTPEGKALNRRVEILVAREGSF